MCLKPLPCVVCQEASLAGALEPPTFWLGATSVATCVTVTSFYHRHLLFTLKYFYLQLSYDLALCTLPLELFGVSWLGFGISNNGWVQELSSWSHSSSITMVVWLSLHGSGVSDISCTNHISCVLCFYNLAHITSLCEPLDYRWWQGNIEGSFQQLHLYSANILKWRILTHTLVMHYCLSQSFRGSTSKPYWFNDFPFAIRIYFS